MNRSQGPPVGAPALHIYLDAVRSPAVVRLLGELDLVATPRLGRVLDRLRERGHREITIDVAGLHFLGTAGLGELKRSSDLLRAHGGRLVLTGLSPWMRRLLEIIGLPHVRSER